jgi:hypothetical protein
MTLPATAPITLLNVKAEAGLTGDTSLSWLAANTKAGQVPSPNNLRGYLGKAWFKNTNEGNCANGNCTANCNCGNIQCNNCVIAAPVNCANCDAREWMQNNCNCACTYNCTAGATSYNCNCACACQCDCLFSDDRLKDREEDVSFALAKVRRLKGFFYRGNRKAGALGLSTERDVGVSAQDVERVMPEALGPMVDGQYLSVRYERLVPLLIEAIKEMDAKISSLQKTNP